MKPFHYILLFLTLSFSVFSQTTYDTIATKKVRCKWEAILEPMLPTHKSRSIQTVSGHFLVGVEFFKKTPFSIYGGITTTYAWGTIVQWGDNFNEITYQNKAFGAGPLFLLRFEPFVYKDFSLAPELSGGLIFYTNRFPYGGDIYNFMWRMGVTATYRITQKFAVNANAKWMHVSNGQGFGPQNPSYEAWGVGFGFMRYIGSR